MNPPKKNFFVRNRVLFVGLIGLTFIHVGWFHIASDPAFNSDADKQKKVSDYLPAYIKSKALSAPAGKSN